jgi:hypothetical protein
MHFEFLVSVRPETPILEQCPHPLVGARSRLAPDGCRLCLRFQSFGSFLSIHGAVLLMGDKSDCSVHPQAAASLIRAITSRLYETMLLKT